MSCVKFLNVQATAWFFFKYFLRGTGSVPERFNIVVFRTLITPSVIHQKTSRILVNIN